MSSGTCCASLDFARGEWRECSTSSSAFSAVFGHQRDIFLESTLAFAMQASLEGSKFMVATALSHTNS